MEQSKDFAEFHLGRTINLSALADLLNEINIERFSGFVRVNEAGEGRFVLSFARIEGGEVSLLTLIRENPSQLYAEVSLSFLGSWVLEVYTAEICARTGALVSTLANRMLHPVKPLRLPTFADWLLHDPDLARMAEALFAAHAPTVPLPLRGIVSFKERHTR